MKTVISVMLNAVKHPSLRWAQASRWMFQLRFNMTVGAVMRNRQPATYIMASKPNGTIYIGVTSDLVQRIYQHRNHLVSGFTKKYECIMLVYFKFSETMATAIACEKKLKGWKRSKKIALIEADNPEWEDLWSTITA
jgi:putative endonuclease